MLLSSIRYEARPEMPRATPQRREARNHMRLRRNILRFATAASVMAVAAACGDDPVDIIPVERGDTISADITADRTLYSDTLYTLSGFIRVANGATLTI